MAEEKKEMVDRKEPQMGENLLMAKLAMKILAVVNDVGWVEKAGKNTVQNYTYVRDVDITDKVRKALIANKLVVLPTQVNPHTIREIQGKNGPIAITSVPMAYKLIDAETGYMEVVGFEGTGMDSGDKGIYKAITGATKYFNSKVFHIPTGDDPEADSKDDIPQRPAAQKPVAPGNSSAPSLPGLTGKALEVYNKIAPIAMGDMTVAVDILKANLGAVKGVEKFEDINDAKGTMILNVLNKGPKMPVATATSPAATQEPPF